MRPSELARSAGCHSETVRFYEARGLLPEPPRNAAGHRVYGREHARRLRFVVRARELGFSLDQITQPLRLEDDGGSICAEAKTLTLGRLNDVGRKIADLRKLEQALRYMVASVTRALPEAAPSLMAYRNELPRIETWCMPRPLTSP